MEMERNDTPSGVTPGTAPAAGKPAEPLLTRPNGPAVAVMIATGVGILVLGVLTTVSEASKGLAEFLEFSERVGPLSGKTIFAVIGFVVSWAGLHMALRDRDVRWVTAITALAVLFVIGMVLVFPPFFKLFESD